MSRRRLPIMFAVAAAAPGWAQDVADPAVALTTSSLASSWWAVIGMGLVLLLAWGITRWIAQPFLRLHEAADQDAAAHAPQAVASQAVASEAISGEGTLPASAPAASVCLSVGELVLDPMARRVSVADEQVPLTSTEFDLLRFFLEHEGEALSRADLLREVWGHQQPVYSRTVDTHVQRLRDKLGPCRDQLETVRGVGYRLNAPVMA